MIRDFDMFHTSMIDRIGSKLSGPLVSKIKSNRVRHLKPYVGKKISNLHNVRRSHR